MWKLRAPELKDALSDIDNLIAAHKGLDEADKIALSRIFTLYHAQDGHIERIQDQELPSRKREAMKELYAKTYADMELHYIRAELQKDVNRCPFCGISEASQLDHHQPKSEYGSVAVCRLNLVPSCGVCNNKKRAGEDYVHAYYDSFPDSDFLIAEITVCGESMAVSFKIDPDMPEDLRRRMENQMDKLELHDRLRKEANTFLMERFATPPETDEELAIRLEAIRQNMMYAHGRNDWRTALIRALQTCPQFNASLLSSYIRYLKMKCQPLA